MSILGRLLALCSVLVAVLVFYATASVASEYPAQEFGDWSFLLPIVAPLLVAAIALGVFFLPKRSRLISGCVWGAFVGANLLLIHQALRLTLQNELIRSDGVAYWGMLSLPAFYGGLYAVGGGAVLGLATGFILHFLSPGNAESSDAPYDGPASLDGNSGTSERGRHS